MFLTTTEVMRKESKIGEDSEQFSSLVLEPWTIREERQREWWRERTDAVRKGVSQDTLPAYATDTDLWGEARQELLNKH